MHKIDRKYLTPDYKITPADMQDIGLVVKAYTKQSYTIEQSHLRRQLIRIWPQLLAMFSGAESLTLYRGLEFDKNHLDVYESLLNTAKKGKYNDKQPSSWTPDLKTAKLFAFGQSSVKKSIAGMILKVKIDGDKVIDLETISQLGENEVLLPPGVFDIKLVDYTEL